MRLHRLVLLGLTALAMAGCDLDQFRPRDNNKVAVILPFSGPFASVGGEMRNAIALAIGDRASDLEIQYFDSLGTAEGALAAGQAARAYEAGLVLGPLVGTNVAAVRQGLGNGPAIVSFSNDITKASPNNFIFNLTPAASTQRILQYAATNGKRNLGILYPDNALGQISANAAAALAPGLGLTIVASLPYAVDAGREGAASRQAAAEQMAALREEIDGLFLPDRGPRLREITTLAFFYELEPTEEAYLGTHLMDDPALSSEPALRGAHFTGIAETLNTFSDRYKQEFGASPQIHSVSAYDAMSMALILAQNGQNLTTQSLTNPRGFVGVLGTYRLLDTGQVERLLGIKTMGGEGIEPVELPGRSFLF